ncbi:microtubule organization protein AKNA-like [Cheilinus undulatus]|uniref:microtubule organization protein AKNA-like n=1 Tax=Cheilinus undulatus TaxID=241271 RepID=UPI001BD413C2|nr:microtubule organization protein AKNA-like [Cheilinus undulatus]
MEGEPDESDEDLQGEGKPRVLWEKCIQQSIFVDLSEDESIHLSDLESSLALHLSQVESAASEASIHLSGSSELSALDVSSSELSTVSSQSERPNSKNKSNLVYVSAIRPNTMQDKPLKKIGYEDAGQNTSDEEQDDLPYDGDLGSSYFNQMGNSEGEGSSDGRKTAHASPDMQECYKSERDGFIEGLVYIEKPTTLSQVDANTKEDNIFKALKPSEFASSCPADINQVLLRHFSREELLHPGRLLEAETLPEVSLLESMDDTALSKAPSQNCVTTVSKQLDRNSGINQSFCVLGSDEMTQRETQSLSLEEEEESSADNKSISTSSATLNSTQGIQHASAEDVENSEKAEEDEPVQRVPLVRTKSFTEMKYGQGQVHYPLPDFSKVAPKVKIPKASSGTTKPVPQCPITMHKAQSSPEMLNVISRVLEDSVQLSENPYMVKDEDKQTPPAMVHHLQAEYDKLLTKYAEAENLIDQMRIGANTQPSSELMLYFDDEDDQSENRPVGEGGHLGSFTPLLPPTKVLDGKGEKNSQSHFKELNADSSSQPVKDPSEGEKMTAELRDIISQFMQTVEEFRSSVSNMSVSTAEQQMMLRSLMESQDQLERKYICKKDEHRALEMQNYMGLSRNTGTFDPNRLVEGDIFRIGMHLEDIKEMIDKNVREQISPPHSSSTPTPMTETQHVKLSPLRMPTPSPPPSLHEGQSSGFSTWGLEMENDEEIKGEEKDARVACGGNGLQQSGEVSAAGFSLRNTEHTSCHSRSSQGSVERVEINTLETEEERSSALSDVIDHSNIIAYLNRVSLSSEPTQRAPDSHSTPVLHAAEECDLGYCLSLAVEVSSSSAAPRDSATHKLSKPPINTSSVSQRIVSPETDSGFGSSYLNQSGTGSFQTNLHTESVQSQNDGLSSADSEGSCSNLQTAIHSASLSSKHGACPHPSVKTQSSGAADAVERWVESTTKEPPVRLQGSECSLPAQLHHHVSEPILSVSMDTEERVSPLTSCSCNSEAILALQSEVSRLKKDLEKGLVQLPHLAQKMDYLTSRYKQDRQERRSKSRPRTQLRLSCNSVWKPLSSRQSGNNLSSSQMRIEDWISSDMDPSKSKGTDSGDTAGSETMLQFHSSPGGGRRGSDSVLSSPELHNKPKSNKGSGKISPIKTSGLTSSFLKGGKEVASGGHSRQRSSFLVMDSFSYKESWSLSSSPSLQKPLLQINYGSSSSLPASYKVKEPPLQYTSHHRKRSTQSDTALLPSNVYFQRTLSPVSAPSKSGIRTSRRKGSKEEEMSRALDQAIEVALSMKKTTDRMAERLSADLAKAKLHRKMLNMQPQGGRKHHAL